jgi:hypothetical protein
MLLTASTVLAQKWSFVVCGDGRADTKGNRPEDKNGVNVVITGEIAQATVQEHAKFLIWTGDLVGGAKDKSVFETELLTWRGLMTPLYDKGIGVYPVRGNHETHCKESVEVWNKVFAGKYGLPKNGPEGEQNLTYFIEEGPVLMIGLDEYSAPVKSVNQVWLNTVLKDHKKHFIFAAGHEPAFMDGHHTDVLDVDPVKRDAFWTSLVNAGARAFFAGHDHLYDHMLVTKAGTLKGKEIHQMVAGTAGAPYYDPGPYTGVNSDWTLTRVKSIGKTYGYLLVEVDGDKITISFKGRKSPGVYEVMDQVVFTVG